MQETKEDTIIYPPSKGIGLWFIAFIMILAVYFPNIHQNVKQHNPVLKTAGQHQAQSSAMSETEVLNYVDQTVHLSLGVLENQPNAQSLKKSPEKSEMISPDLSVKNEGLTLYSHIKKFERLYHPIILRAANRYQVDPAIIKAIIMAESSYNPQAVSKRGAKGLMQLMPRTAREMGIKDIFNPEHNIDAGVRYYKKLLRLVEGDVKLALAAYNAGLRKVKQYDGVPPFKATRHYIKKVFEYYQYYKEQMAMKEA